MVKSFEIRNFKSVLSAKLDLTYLGNKAPNGYKNQNKISFFGPQRVVPLLLLLGPNGAGKTNILSALLCYLLILKTGIKSRFYPNKLNNKYSSTVFTINFLYSDVLYTHTIEYNQEAILCEQLFRKNRLLFKIENGKVLNQSLGQNMYGLKTFQEILSIECMQGNFQQYSFFTKLIERLPGLDSALTAAYNYLADINRVRWGKDSLRPADIFEELKQLNLPIKETLDKITKILQSLDVPITRLQLNQEKNPSLYTTNLALGVMAFVPPSQADPYIYKLISFHKNLSGQEVPFDFFKEESRGTIRLFSIVCMFLLTTFKGGLLIWDELDTSIHPLLLKKIMDIFLLKDFNKGQGQLIASLHNPYILENKNLRISNISFVNNNLNTGTQITRIKQASKARNDLNFRKQYLSGEFKCIPNIKSDFEDIV